MEVAMVMVEKYLEATLKVGGRWEEASGKGWWGTGY